MPVPEFIRTVMGPPRPEEGRAALDATRLVRAAVAFSQLPDAKRFQLMKLGRVPPAPPGWKMYEDGTFGPKPKLGPPAPPPPGSLYGGVSVAHPIRKHA